MSETISIKPTALPEDLSSYAAIEYQEIEGFTDIRGIFEGGVHKKTLSHEHILEAYGVIGRDVMDVMPQQSLEDEPELSDFEKLNAQISMLSEAVSQMQARFNALEQRNAELEAQNAQKDAIIAELQRQLDEKDAASLPFSTEPGPEELDSPAPRLKTVVLQASTENEPELEQPLYRHTELDAYSPYQSRGKRLLNWMMKPTYAATTQAMTMGSKTTQEEVDNRKQEGSKNRKRTVAAIGAVGVLAAGCAISYLVLHKTGHHIDFHNPLADQPKTGVELPKNLHLVNASGHDIIVDNHGQTVVGLEDIKKGLFERQGKLSAAARKILIAKHYILSQKPLGQHYMTIVKNQ